MFDLFVLTLIFASTSASALGGCTAVTPDKCGTDWDDSCLKCGTSSTFDCEECCSGCRPVTKGSIKYCECSGPSPQSGNWTSYQVAGMDVLALTGSGTTEKVVVLLHGGGGSGTDWRYQYNAGWLGDTSGIKYVFPTSPNHLWYGSTKQSGCGNCDTCAYTTGSIEESATRVATLIEHEMPIVGSYKKVYLGGFSQGGQMTAYMQIAKLGFALGGTIVMDGYALPPVCDAQTVKSQATYSGKDMRWFIYWGGADPIFPPTESLAAYHGMFSALNLTNQPVFEHTEPGMTHTLIQMEFVAMVNFIRGE